MILRNGTLSLTASTSVGLTIGGSGEGTYEQLGGLVDVSSLLIAAQESQGEYRLTDGTLRIRTAVGGAIPFASVGHRDVGKLIQSGGTVDATEIRIGRFAGGDGEYRIEGGISHVDLIRVGDEGNGTLILSGGDLNADQSFIGDQASSVGAAIVTGVGMTWTSGEMIVGNHGSGGLTIEAGGRVSSSTGFIGRASGSNGVATVTGTSSQWTSSSELRVGDTGQGTLLVAAGASVQNSGIGSIGTSSASEGEATVTGSGSSWASFSELQVGSSGIGTLTIESGGIVSSEGIASVGTFTGSTGTAVVRGSGSTWTSHSYLQVGGVGAGTLRIEDGGNVSNQEIGSVATFTGSTGAAIVRGSSSDWTNHSHLQIGGEGVGTLRIEEGGKVSNEFIASIGTFAGSQGEATVTGIGSTWTSYNELQVGGSGVGTLTIESGGNVFNAGVGSIGTFPSASGTATVQGAGSSWTNSSVLWIGSSGTGTLNILDGGIVSAFGGAFIGQNGTVLGDGTLAANVTNDGTVAPGASPGALQIAGNYTQTAGILQIEIASPTSFDKLIVDGDISLGGELQVALQAFSPISGTSFDILDWTGTRTGTFATLSLPTLAGPLAWNTSQLYTTGVLSVVGAVLAGDYNEDGIVDAADYVVWRNGLGTTYTQSDYNVWRANFGRTAGSGAGSLRDNVARAPVPEPTSTLLILGTLGIHVVSVWRRPKQLGGRIHSDSALSRGANQEFRS
jgi:T5SS/PEP-CTERM-associated repeat protein